MGIKSRYSFTAIFALLLTFALSGCSAKTDEGKAVITVNGTPIPMKDFKRELSVRVRQSPTLEVTRATLYDLADTLIKRRLIIQKATRRNMTQEPGFVEAIKAFWEQTLIKNFIEYKNREFDRYIFVTDKEVESYYRKLKTGDVELPPLDEARAKIRKMVREAKKSDALESWLDKEKKTSEIHIDKELLLKQVPR
ncbi:SurA N-terminal domain-containing protein [Omnitrophica bacterium]|nr:SurA N-terminal domain-containing protein [Candidatus Omnitrophota bacterium]